MSDIMIEILEMIDLDQSPRSVANMLNIPVSWVYDAIEMEAE